MNEFHVTYELNGNREMEKVLFCASKDEAIEKMQQRRGLCIKIIDVKRWQPQERVRA